MNLDKLVSFYSRFLTNKYHAEPLSEVAEHILLDFTEWLQNHYNIQVKPHSYLNNPLDLDFWGPLDIADRRRLLKEKYGIYIGADLGCVDCANIASLGEQVSKLKSELDDLL